MLKAIKNLILREGLFIIISTLILVEFFVIIIRAYPFAYGWPIPYGYKFNDEHQTFFGLMIFIDFLVGGLFIVFSARKLTGIIFEAPEITNVYIEGKLYSVAKDNDTYRVQKGADPSAIAYLLGMTLLGILVIPFSLIILIVKMILILFVKKFRNRYEYDSIEDGLGYNPLMIIPFIVELILCIIVVYLSLKWSPYTSILISYS